MKLATRPNVPAHLRGSLASGIQERGRLMEPANAPAAKLKIVIAEDDPNSRLFLREALVNDLGHQVVGEAATGTDMVRVVLEEQPDVVVFDIHLPRLDETRVVAAVAITADRDQALVKRAMDEHVLAYLLKPVEAHQLGPAVQVAWARFGELSTLMEENASLRQSLQSRKLIERAKGVLMKRHRWSEADAFRRLQRGAMNRRVPMVDLAQAILNGQEIDLGAP